MILVVKLFDWLLPTPWLARPLSERHPVRPTPAGLLRPDLPARFIRRRRTGAGFGGKGRLDCSIVLAGAAGDTRTIWTAGVIANFMAITAHAHKIPVHLGDLPAGILLVAPRIQYPYAAPEQAR